MVWLVSLAGLRSREIWRAIFEWLGLDRYHLQVGDQGGRLNGKRNQCNPGMHHDLVSFADKKYIFYTIIKKILREKNI